MTDLRTDIVEVYIFRVANAEAELIELLQMRRSQHEVLPGTWQPVMGHVNPGETADAAAIRELYEETGYGRSESGDYALTGMWQLEQPNCYFLNAYDSIIISPCFAARVEYGPAPRMDSSHDAFRWIPAADAESLFLWPGQRIAVRQIMEDIISSESAIEPVLRVKLP